MAAEYVADMGRRIKEAREGARLTQAELAEAIPGKADGTQISKWERGVHRPSDDTLEHIAAATNVTVSRLLADPALPVAPDLMETFAGDDSRALLTAINGKLDEILSRLPDPATQFEQELSQAARQAQKPTGHTGTKARSARRQGKAR